MEQVILRYKPTMTIHVVWHPSFIKGEDFADSIYKYFCRDMSEDIVYRKPGIPVFFNKEWGEIKEIESLFNVDESKFTAIIVLVDDNLVASPEWCDTVKNVWRKIKEHTTVRMYPVSISKNAFNIPDINGINFIRLHQEQDQVAQEKRLLGSLSHELCRILLERPRVSEATTSSPAPITLFLSHSKQDGEKLSINIRNYIHSETALKTFFDANDIAPGFDFEKEINSQMEETALLVIHTDSYASREWCRREVIRAKMRRIPIVVVNVVNRGEVRSFPYLGNVPTIRWNGKKNAIKDIIDIAVLEVLRDVYTREHLKNLLEMYRLSKDVAVISNHPELFDFINLPLLNTDEKTKMVLYPDPPVGYEEIHVLKGVKPDHTFITPTMLPLIQKQKLSQAETEVNSLNTHNNIKIGVSISKSFDLERYGFNETHLEDVINEFARYLLVNGFVLCYGGDLRPGGFTNLLHDIIRSYFPTQVHSSHRIQNFLAWPLYNEYTVDQLASISLVSNIHRVAPPSGISEQFINAPSFDSLAGQVARANSLSRMRVEMNTSIDCRLAIGGALHGFVGNYPGILEEVMLSMQSNKPTYLIGGFGGCTKVIIDAICGGQPKELSSDYQLSNEQYRKVYEAHNSSYSNGEEINYEKIVSYFNQAGVEGLKNGLSKEENLVLFQTPHIPEMISLVLKGLSSLN